jgi:thiol-disulfide isomerase/thioredoxin
MKINYMQVILQNVIFILFIQCSQAADRGQLSIKGRVADVSNKPIGAGEIFITSSNDVSLNNIPVAGTFAKNGEFYLTTINKVHQYIHFVSQGKITCSFLLPPVKTETLAIEVILQNYDEEKDTMVLGGSMGGAIVKTNNDEVNQWIKVKSLADYAPWHRGLKEIQYKIKNGTIEGFKYDLSSYYNSMLQIYNNSNDRELKNYVLLNLSTLCIGNKYAVDKKYLHEAIEKISPADNLWFADGGMGIFFRGCFTGLEKFQKANPMLENFVDSLIEQTPFRNEPPFILADMLSMIKNTNSREFKKYYSMLLSEYPDSRQAADIKKRVGDNVRISSGKNIPGFSVINLDKPGSLINESQLKSKLTLIDFWATWCIPCIAQFKSMEKVYDKYKSKGFEILSISIDEKVDAVNTFRTKRYKMPWLNGFSGIDSVITDKFEVFAVPRMILIDDKGKIVSVSRNELEDEALEKTLIKYLENKD